MKVEVVKELHSEELIELFIADKQDQETYSYQNRRPNFFSLYNHFKSDPATYFIGRNESDKAVFCYGMIPYKSATHTNFPTYYITDLYIHPSLRSTRKAWEFINLSIPDLGKSIDEGILWLIENKPGVIRAFNKFTKRCGIQFNYTGMSLGRELYLKGSEINVEKSSPMNLEMFLKKYSEKKVDFILQSENKSFYNPQLNINSLKIMSENSKNFQILPWEVEDQLSSITLLADLYNVKKLIYTGKSSPYLNYLEKETPINYLFCDHYGTLPNQSRLVEQAIDFAISKNVDILNFRDLTIPDNIAHQVKNLLYSRRVGVLYNKGHSYWDKFFNKDFSGERVKLHSLTL